MIDLSNVSLVIIDDYGDDLSENNIRNIINKKTVEFATKNIKFGDIIEITPFGNITNYKFDGKQSVYSKFCIKNLPYLIKTDYYLIQQWDGFIINPTLWDNEFFNFEYIGGGHTLQCGGFSLRRTKDMVYISDRVNDDNYDNENEDDFYSKFFCDKGLIPPIDYRFKRPYCWENEKNVGKSVTERFCSFITPNLETFGFHFSKSKFNFMEYYKYIKMFTDDELTKIEDYLKKRSVR